MIVRMIRNCIENAYHSHDAEVNLYEHAGVCGARGWLGKNRAMNETVELEVEGEDVGVDAAAVTIGPPAGEGSLNPLVAGTCRSPASTTPRRSSNEEPNPGSAVLRRYLCAANERRRGES